MTREEAEHFVKMYIECDLYTRIRAIKEGKFPNEQEMIEEAIKSFEATLTQWHEQIPNIHSFVEKALKEIEVEYQKVEKMRSKEKEEKER